VGVSGGFGLRILNSTLSYGMSTLELDFGFISNYSPTLSFGLVWALCHWRWLFDDAATILLEYLKKETTLALRPAPNRLTSLSTSSTVSHFELIHRQLVG
jgi:hypothetical protein